MTDSTTENVPPLEEPSLPAVVKPVRSGTTARTNDNKTHINPASLKTLRIAVYERGRWCSLPLRSNQMSPTAKLVGEHLIPHHLCWLRLLF
jgi:hypothetical protein